MKSYIFIHINSVFNWNDNAAIYSTHYTGHGMSLNIVLKQIRYKEIFHIFSVEIKIISKDYYCVYCCILIITSSSSFFIII